MIITLSLGGATNTIAATTSGFGSIQIIVTDQNGTPIPNVNLCLAMPSQSVGRMTDQNGVYNTSLPAGETTIRFSRNGYANAQDTVTITNGGNLVRQIRLQPGLSTPLPADCGLAATTIPGNNCAKITSVQVTGGTTTTNRALSMVVGFDKQPASYRITEFTAAERYPESQFDPEEAFNRKNVKWQRVTSPILNVNFSLTEPHYGTHHLYLQTRQFESGCISRPYAVSVTLAPANYQTYTLKGPELQQLINEAKARGYEFHTRFSVQEFSPVRNATCGPPSFLQLRNYNTADRRGDKLWQEVDAEFEAFGGPLLLKPFWSVENSVAYDPSLPPTCCYSQADPNRDTKAVVFERYAQSGCPNGCQQSPKRVFLWKRKTYATFLLSGTVEQEGNYYCELRGETQANLTELVLKGPAGQNPIDALEDLRLLRQEQLRRAPPPRFIIPRGVDGKNKNDGNQTVDETTELEQKP